MNKKNPLTWILPIALAVGGMHYTDVFKGFNASSNAPTSPAVFSTRSFPTRQAALAACQVKGTQEIVVTPVTTLNVGDVATVTFQVASCPIEKPTTRPAIGNFCPKPTVAIGLPHVTGSKESPFQQDCGVQEKSDFFSPLTNPSAAANSWEVTQSVSVPAASR